MGAGILKSFMGNTNIKPNINHRGFDVMEIYRARWPNRSARGDLSVSSNGIRLRGAAFQHLRGCNYVMIGVDGRRLILRKSDDPSNLKLRLAAKGKIGEIGGKHLTQWLLEHGFNKGQYKTQLAEDQVIVQQELA
ncbi:uncharacterized Fe-S protein PflX, homolog of pyruvate formate lyase activating proteins [Moorella thermoacetica Y72]|uniref:Uncharacterized Fe-S protein PflX, homolog of pyruvate formate lyase activating proteins n=1 Tax=Moorella thermoacetica Y72 TaxID=1325331 RepID=A0A0S6UGN4_NEOTH|nr:uncharacterized Fe-S protein PflX, homolog of pyruvate formate lyase activating proteins [Moorella thermoacetica Y72]